MSTPEKTELGQFTFNTLANGQKVMKVTFPVPGKEDKTFSLTFDHRPVGDELSRAYKAKLEELGVADPYEGKS